MKKLFFYLAAASAVLAGCAKTEIDVETPIDAPVVVPAGSFVGTFAINEGSKTSIVPGEENYNVYWEEDDRIQISNDGGTTYYDFKIDSTSVVSVQAVFVPVDPTEIPEDFFSADSYKAKFGDATATSFEQSASDNVKHLPMTAEAGSDRNLVFSMVHAVLAVNIPANVSAKSVKVAVRGGSDVSSVSSSSALTAFYVPVPAGSAQYNISAYSGENCSNEIAESMKMQVSASMSVGDIYPFTFTPTLEITSEGTHKMKSYPADYKVHILDELSDVTVTYADGATQHPANVYINANEKAVASLTINTADSHVEIEKGNSANVTSKTSKNSFVVKPTFSISDKLSVEAGSVAAEGNTDGTKNVKEIVLDYPDLESMKGVIVYVSDVTAGAPVIITNNTESTESEPITVCGKEQKTSETDGGYKITDEKAQNIQKLETVAAKVGDVVYPTLKAAYNNAQDGQTLTLINDIDLKNDLSSSEKYFKIEKSIDINLNGHTVTGKTETNPKSDVNDRVYVFVYDGYGPVHEQSKSRISGKVYNGTIICDHAGVYASEDADVVIENLTITQSKHVADYFFTHCALAASYGSTLTVKSGSYTGDAAVGIFDTGGIVTIEDGSFTGRKYAFDVYVPSSTDSESNSELYVKAGTISGSCNLPSGTPHGSFTRTVSYTGGAFDVDPSEHVAAGYEAVQIGDVWVVQVKGGKVAKIGETTYATLQEAFAAVGSQTGITLELLADVDLKNEAWTPKVFNYNTFDGNGYTVKNLNVSGNNKMQGFIGNGDCSTIKNLTIDGATVTGINHVGVIAGRGMCTKIENCHVKNATVTSNVYNNDDGDKVAAICGYLSGEWHAWVRNCSVENTTVTGYRDLGSIVGYAEAYEPQGTSVGIADISDCSAKNVQIICKTDNNYKQYSLKSEFHAGQIVGELQTYATVSNNTVTNVTVTYTPDVPSAVAKIGNKTYASLADAIADVPTDGTQTTIQMIGDEDFGEFSGNKVVIPGTANIILDLNGKTISGTGNGSVASYLLYNKGIMKIVDSSSNEDGKITYYSTTPDPGYGYGTSTILNRGTLEIASGNVVNTSNGGASYAVDNQTLWFDEIIPVAFTLSGTGNVNCTTGDAAVRQGIACGGYTKQGETIVNNVNINGGTVTGDIWVQVLGTASMGNLSITDGVITGRVYNNSGDVTNVTYSISGGRFNKKISLQGKQNFISGGFFTTVAKEETPATALASGKAFVASTAPDASTYPWMVGESAKVAKVGTTEYSDLHEALEAAKTAGTTCELLSDVDLNGVTWTPITDFAGTLDGKGYTISNLTVNGAGCLGLIGSAPENGGGVVKNLTITNANITGTGNNVAVVFGSAFRASINNVSVTNSTVTSTGEYVGAITGGTYADVEACSVSNTSITGLDQVGSVVGYLCGADLKNCSVTNNTVKATHATEGRAGALIGKAGLDDSAYAVYVSGNTISGGSVEATYQVGGIAGQMFGDGTPAYYVQNNSIDVKLNGTGTKCPIANLRSSVTEAFCNLISTNITGNTWTENTDNVNVNSYTYPESQTKGAGDQVVWNGSVGNIAKIGSENYTTLAAALKAAQSGNTIEILDGNWGPAAVGTLTTAEALQVRYKSLTIQPAAGANPTFTSKVYFGYNDSGTANATITVKNLNFVNAQLCVSNYVQATVEGCTFKNSDKTDATLLIRDACCTTKKSSGTYPASQVTVKDCVVDGSNVGASGIRIVNSGNVSITGTTVKNSLFNGILFESNSSVDNTAAKTVAITGNNLTNWNAGNAAESGRALRMAMGTMASGSTITIENNVFEKATLGFDKPDFVKLTEAANATISLENNYWNGMSVADFSGKSDYYTVNGSSPAISSVKTTK